MKLDCAEIRHIFSRCAWLCISKTQMLFCVLLHHLFLIWGITSWWSSGIKLSYCISLQLCYLKLLVKLNVVHSHCFSCIFVYSYITRHALSLILFLMCHYRFWRNFDIYDKLCDVLQIEMIVLLLIVVPFKANEVVWILLYNVWAGRRSWKVIVGWGRRGQSSRL